MKQVICVIGLVSLLTTFSGCGTIVHGNDQKIHVTSAPSGAEVLYEGAVRGITPTDVAIKRRPLKNVLTLRKEGYEEAQLVVKNGVSLWALLGNIVFGGVPGWVIDAATGSFGATYQDSFTVDLPPSTPEPEASP